MIKVGINGFGRIGRAIFRNNLNKEFFQVVAINDINPDNNNIAYTLNFDTLYDRLDNAFKVDGDNLVSADGSHKIALSHERSVADVDWKSHGVDFVIDASGVYQNVLDAQKVIESGQAKKVFVTHSPKNVDFTMVLGANEHLLDVEKHHVISTSICDATAIAPVTKAIKQTFGIEHGYATTLHPWLNYQNLMDGPASSWSVPGEIYHHFALGRSSIGNMIPKPTSAITATCTVLEEEGITEEIIGSFSYRTPTAIVGSADLTFHISEKAQTKDVLDLFEKMESSQQWPIVHNNWEPLVSLDFKKADYAAVIDHRWTNVLQGHMLKLVLWYDNEWGYAARVLDQIKLVEEKLG
ncbi:MAG TPA: glyceraldehyde-3-phosphate dehydrogenase [Cryomorphaceae bacterium]|nr:glyceraldehyde-3-phosphate dehydrogenase [Owenweeksia sp.]HAD97482.1 glyceraldehyde-3-phosphate dehydrogenase [Cryomorphaceae bacterium]HBF19623.1 glyceraldehyde-3-phosphate dehydrogenase [Cryomorphaceae bacterium]HCQ16049.1 glyceraldehyde-3-phosphate dehydrogenase [Cryomorphaceae bacterium]|tara:strand:- start:566 stop:1621 length:1056 start_codon:yes stop_codon:yes gene_type:complete